MKQKYTCTGPHRFKGKVKTFSIIVSDESIESSKGEAARCPCGEMMVVKGKKAK